MTNIPLPPKDVALLPVRNEPYDPNDWPTNTPPQEVDPQRTRIVDQLRAQQQKSPYLSTNPLLTPQAPAGYASPYLNVTQEIQKSTTGGSPLETQRMQDAMNNYYI
jgi:hypothetical protein